MSELPPATPPSPGDDAPTPPPAPPAAEAARAKQRRQQAAWPAPTPQAPVDAAPAPVEEPPAPAAPAPISLAGAGMPAFLGAPDPLPAAPEPEPTAPEPEPVAPPAPAAPFAAAPPTVAAPELPAEQGAPAPGAPASTAPPGFTATRVQAAASPTLLAVDPSDEDEDAPQNADPDAPAPGAGTEPPGLARLIIDGLPRQTDLRQIGRDRGATVRVVRAAIVGLAALLLLGPLLISALERIGFMAQAIDHVRAIFRFPGTYGMPWLTGIFGVISLVGVILANMERYGERMGDRKEPVRRLNIGLGVMLATALAGGLFAAFAERAWAAAVAATTFWVLLCLLVPIGRTPGGWAMRYQPERGWALLFLASVVGVILEPSLPVMLTAVLAFTRVRTNWAGVRDDVDAHAGGPVDGTNRRSAMILMVVALLAGSLGLGAMSVNSSSLPTAETESPFPYAKEGPTVDPDAVNPTGPSPAPEVPASTPPAATPAAPQEEAPAASTPAETGAPEEQPSTPEAPVESTPAPPATEDQSSGGVGVLR